MKLLEIQRKITNSGQTQSRMPVQLA